jgi:isopentenyl-diphosphate Delta-isomerase
MEEVILVDEKDNEVGVEEKIVAHKKGKLHRAISVFVFNSKGELLLQKRAKSKYHCGGLWTNTCCSHPRQGETAAQAAKRRLKEEMGIECQLKSVGNFTYQAAFENGLIENEFDHVFFGIYDDEPEPDAAEADDYRWIKLERLEKEIEKNPKEFTPWLRIILDKNHLGEIKFDKNFNKR